MSEAETAAALRHTLVGALTDSGSLHSRRWIDAFERVPRHVFVPRFLSRGAGGTFEPVEGTDPALRREGGLILVDLYRDLGGGALARLRVEDGRASGRFMPYFGGFMPTRTYRRVSTSELFEKRYARGEGARRSTAIGSDVLEDDTFAMLAALRVDAGRLWLLPDDGPEEFWLVDRKGSWACRTTDEAGDLIAVQGGPARL